MSEHTKGYWVTPDGKVFSIESNWRGYGEREMKQIEGPYGYLFVRLTVDGKRTTRLVHVLVATAYIGEKPSCKHQVRHLDGNKRNNNVKNLLWGTAKENAHDREIHGKTSCGESHSKAIKRCLPKVNPNKGKPLNTSHREKLSNAMTGKPWSEARRISNVR